MNLDEIMRHVLGTDIFSGVQFEADPNKTLDLVNCNAVFHKGSVGPCCV